MLFSGKNLLSIVNNILDFSKIEAHKVVFEKVEMNLLFLARNIIGGFQSFAADKIIDLKLEVGEGVDVTITGDPTRTTQIITNLVQNAIKFTIKGSVTLQLITEAKTANYITIMVRVEDTGIGIPKDKQKIIFDQFSQADSSISRSFGGTGLGLTITKKLLDLQGVTLHLESEVGRGSVFYFTQTFPLHKQDKTKSIDGVAAQDHFTKNRKPLHGVVLLLVEDSDFNIVVAQHLLEDAGAIVDIAYNGQEAVDKLDLQRHHLILMDMQMPVMDGYEAARIIRNKKIHIPIIAFTATLPEEIENQIDNTIFNDYITKPFDPDRLIHIILKHTNTEA